MRMFRCVECNQNNYETIRMTPHTKEVLIDFLILLFTLVLGFGLLVWWVSKN